MIQVTCRNIGMIEEAQVSLNGLTVIAGENDTGKSTLGKLLFTLVKAFDPSDLYKIYMNNKMDKIYKLLNDDLYFNLRVTLENDKDLKWLDLYRNQINYKLSFILKQEHDLIQGLKSLLSARFFDLFTPHLQGTLSSEGKRILELTFQKVYEIINESEDPLKISKDKLDAYSLSLFDNEIINKFCDGSGEIVLKEGNIEVIKIRLSEGYPKDVSQVGELYYNDASFIESPIILQMSELIHNSRTVLEGFKRDLDDASIVSIHTKDLIQKLRQPVIPGLIEKNFISKIINGHMDYKEGEMSFVYKKQDQEFKAINIAAGIKSFGILQMLLNKGFIRKRALLILDEPEVNLHPKWQIEYAKMLVKLVMTTEVNILLTSHSPYFIEAIKVFSDKYGFADKTKFYYSEKDKERPVTRITEVTHNLEKVFEALTEPFTDLENETLGDWS